MNESFNFLIVESNRALAIAVVYSNKQEIIYNKTDYRGIKLYLISKHYIYQTRDW